MTLMILGLVLFWATHLFKPMKPALRARLDARLGALQARGLMAIATVVAIVLMVVGYQQANFVNVWFPPTFLTHVNNLLMVLAVLFFTASGIRSGFFRRVRHPQLTAVKIWAVAHLLVNGDLASIILFTGILAWAVVAMIAINRRDGKDWEPRPAGTLKGKLIHGGAALGVFVLIVAIHAWAGVSPFPGGTA